MIELRYFASLRERLGRDQERIDAGAATVAELRARLRQRGGVWAEVLADDQPLLCAVNQALARPETPISDGDEVAFFPPVTGG
jgi:molybdopterin synthase sulfur carrier subunit